MKKITFLILLLLSFVSGTAQEINESIVSTWFGSGTSKAYLIIDFNDGSQNESLIWGYKFNPNDSPTVYNLLQTLANEQECFTFEASPTFLDFVFWKDKGDDSGSDWWKVWSGTNYSNLAMNGGISTRVIANNIYALSYGFMCGAICDSTPSFPTSASSCNSLSVIKITENDISIFPNPATDIIKFQTNSDIIIENLEVSDFNGKKLNILLTNNFINIQNYASGVYLIKIETNKGIITKKIIKK